MRIITQKTIYDYIQLHQEAGVALREWVAIVRKSSWNSFSDVRATFNSVDAVGNQHYVFNIKGNHFRLVVVIKFTIKAVYIRFVGTHSEYEKIDCKNI